MKPALLKRHFLLLLAFLFSVFSLLIWYFFIYNSSVTSDQRSINDISIKVNKQLGLIVDESEKVKATIENSKKYPFSKLLKHNKYPYFIFKNKELFVWSVNNFSPQYEVLQGNYKFKFLNLRNGKYIVYKDFIKVGNDVFELFTFLPLTSNYSIENNYIKSSRNKTIFSFLPYKINHVASEEKNNIYASTGEFLFALEIPKDYDYKNEGLMLLLVISSGISIVFFFLYVLGVILLLNEKNKIDLSIIFLLFTLIIIRGVMLVFNYPFSLFEFDLFNSKYFASSSISPSLADELLNYITGIIFLWYLFKSYHRSEVFGYIHKVKGVWRNLISIIIVILSFYSLYLVFYTIGVLSSHSQWSMDITVDINFNVFRIISIVIFISAFIIYFILSHIFFRVLISLNNGIQSKLLILFLVGGGIFSVILFLLMDFHIWIIIIHIVYFFVPFYLNLFRSIAKLKYTTYIYFLTCAIACSTIGAYSIYNQHLKKSIFDKQHFATDLLFKNDVLGEFLLNEASLKMKEDIFIKHRLLIPFSSKNIIEHKVKRVFLSNYFDKYEVVVSVFDALGVAYEQNQEFVDYFEARNKYAKSKYRTEYPNTYFFTDPETGFVKYICFNKIEMDNSIVGYIIIELRQKKIIPHSVYPELLLDKKRGSPVQVREYNYGVFLNDKLLYTFGNYNYETHFLMSWLAGEDIYQEGVIDDKYHHIAIKGADGKRIVVSSEKYYLSNVFSNFSFLFLILIFFTLIFIVVYAINFRFRYINTTYSAKIQIYLNIAFFLPLLIVSITTLSIISVSYKNNLNNSFIKKVEGVAANISGYYQKSDNLNNNQRENIENTLLQISKLTQSDINLYNSKGRLLITNQPMIYELGIQSRLINPYAFVNVSENKTSTIIVPETIGDLHYNSVYVAIRSIETGGLVGILSMPFFQSKIELDKQIIEGLTTIVNIFVSIFMLFLLLSYLASHILTVPLKIITQKLKKTTLDKNEPIDWKTDDEIGLLVGEYNKMLIKLEESRDALSRSEKESAWREMAKQVAHEIKNPLTPMKLTIQHLQRALKDGGDKASELTNKALDVLLDQINNLNEIATSFSLFAKMPIPKNQRFEISSVLSKVAQLHNNSKDVNVETNIESGDYFVMGDEQLMSGIFTNLIINGLQSVPNERKAIITVNLSTNDSKVLIEIKDNGTGIPASIQHRVFLPNFSTKFSGSGIGLAVAKRGVEHAGGRIWFKTEEDIGTSFYIEIPLTE